MRAFWVHNNAQMTMWEHQMIILEINREKIFNLGNPRINFIHHHQSIGSPLWSHHFQVLPSSTTRLDSICHQAHNQALIQPKNIHVLGHCGKHMISPKDVMLVLKCFPLSNSQYMGRHLQAHLEGLWDCLESIQYTEWHYLHLLHRDNFPVHVEDPQLVFEWNDSSRQWNCAGQILQRLSIIPHHQRISITNHCQL